jgi:hypothetical protein
MSNLRGGRPPPGAEDDGRPIEVKVDPRIAGLFPGFLERRWRDVEVLLELCDAGSFDRIESLGHNLKGTGAAYGLDEVTTIGAALEQAAGSRDGPRVRDLTDQLAAYLGRVRPIIG